MKERKPIFYDAEKVRWRRTRRILEISGVLLTLLLVYFFITVAGSVELPSSLAAGHAPGLSFRQEEEPEAGERAGRTPPPRCAHWPDSRRATTRCARRSS